MHHRNLLQTPSFVAVIVTSFTLIIHIPKTSGQNYTVCSEPFRCGGLNFGYYPFWGGSRSSSCGHPGFHLECQDTSVPFLDFQSVRYRVLDIDGSRQSLTLARNDLWEDICPRFIHDTALNYTNFRYSSGLQNVTLYYGCTIPIVNSSSFIPRQPNQFDCPGNGTDTANSTGFYLVNPTGFVCTRSISVPVNRAAIQNLVNSTALLVTLRDGFGIEWEANNSACDECARSGGRCGHNSSTGAFACFCSDNSYNLTCGNISNGNGDGGNGGVNTPMNIGLAIAGAVIAGFVLGFLIFFCRQRRKRLVVAAAAASSQSVQIESKELPTTPLANKATSVPSDAITRTIPSTKSEFGRNSSYFGIQVFNYQELEEATDNFSRSRELGDGGFGTVYYGILRDGRIVAVKRLYENNFKRVEQFINEVEILTRLRHTNLVTLYGCTSKRSQELVLVYEYVPNGTVADHLHGKRSKSGLLSWPIRLNIAIETAEALAYLHSSDIIHRDVKTNNLLLDNEFHVKVADFGLSRLFPNDVTHISTAPQGTPGYVDPEYYQCYRLTDKSDVYSFGVVLLELLSSLQAVDTNRHRQDINLANMGINKIQNHTLQELVDPSLGFGTNCSARRTMTQVSEIAFRCLQQERDMRPSMQEVVDVLRRIQNKEGLINSLMDKEKEKVVDILIDNVKDNDSPHSPNSVTDKWASNSTPTSSA